MTTLTEYLDLVPSRSRQQPKFIAMITANVSFYVYMQELLNNFDTLFDLDVAYGKQLDTIGLWVGVSRRVAIPITDIYFEWDNANLGWQSGIWQGEFDPASGIIDLPDDVYRILIRAKIAANSWDGTIPNAYEIWSIIFPDQEILIQDNQNMTMDIIILGDTLDALTKALLTGGYLALKPEGVRISNYYYSEEPLLVWDAEGETDLIAGWNVGNWAEQL